ncbi:MAG: 30S ribosomal protein S18 [Proteobacteria bacterium]|nr:30S ribosomal protein S18 [Pseudomonadota bacterium]
MTEQRNESRRGSTGTRSRGGPRRQYRRRPRLCKFCADKTTHINYKQHELVKRYIKESGKIRSRRETGNCATHQRMVAGAIKRARHMALLPFTVERLR